MVDATTADRPGDGRVPALATLAAPAVFALLLLIVPSFSVGFDEAKYLGIGANIWAGHGPYTAFDTIFLLHSPLWMTVLYAPQALVGFDAVAWGHILNGVAGVTVVVLAGIMGRRCSPAAGILAVFAVIAFSYLFQLTRTTRLDVPAAALAMLYLEVGWRAARTGSIRWAIAAGLAFAVAVLQKEVAIPLAPAPILCGVLAGVPWRQILRTTGWTTLFASIGLAPWFLYYAAETGHVYRVESPAWTLPILFAPVGVLIVLGLAAGPLASRRSLGALRARLADRLPGLLRRNVRGVVGWSSAVVWAIAFLFFFSRIARLKGNPLFQFTQYRLYLREWALDLVPIGLFVASGLVLALILLATDRGARERRGVTNALIAVICGAPLVLMVIEVGEPPRNFIAQIATGAALAAGAWTWCISRLVARFTRMDRRPALRQWGLTAFLVIAMLGGGGYFGYRVYLTRAGTGDAGTTAIRTTVAWIKQNVPAGTPIAFGSYLSYEMAYQLVADYPTHHIRQGNVIVDPAMPLGFKRAGEAPSDDWVSADIAPRNINEYQAFRAAWVETSLHKWNIGYWVYSTGPDTAAPTILAQLTPQHGFDLAATWTFGKGSTQKTVSIFRVNLATAALDHTQLDIAPEALTRLVNKLAATPGASRAAAAALVPRIVVYPPSAASDADLARLRALAGP